MHATIILGYRVVRGWFVQFIVLKNVAYSGCSLGVGREGGRRTSTIESRISMGVGVGV